MTQDSAFHNGQQIGDAKSYSAAFFHDILSHLHLGQGGYVIYLSGTPLAVTFSAGQTVTVAAGSAFIAGVYYNNSASLNVVLDNNATIYYRLDRVIIRVDWNAQTARIVAKRGTASSSPVAPELQQEPGNIYEISLALINIPPNFTGFNGQYIFDERLFVASPLLQNTGIKNIMPNSEFIPPADLNTRVPNIPYAMWFSSDVTADNVATAGSVKFDNQARGRSVTVTVTSARTLYTEVWANNGTSKLYTLSFVIQVLSGSPVSFSLDGGATTKHVIPITAEPLQIIVRGSTGISGSTQRVRLHFTSAASVFKLGQITLAFGNTPAPFLPSHEFVLLPYNYPIAVSDTGDSGAERRVYSQDDLWPGTTSLYAFLKSGDTNAAADSIYTSIFNSLGSGAKYIDYLRSETGRLPINTVRRYVQGMIGLDLQYMYSALDYWACRIYIQRNALPDWALKMIGIQT